MQMVTKLLVVTLLTCQVANSAASEHNIHGPNALEHKIALVATTREAALQGMNVCSPGLCCPPQYLCSWNFTKFYCWGKQSGKWGRKAFPKCWCCQKISCPSSRKIYHELISIKYEGSMAEEKPVGVVKSNQGSLFRVSKSCKLDKVLTPVTVSNGMGWNPKNTVLQVSPKGKLLSSVWLPVERSRSVAWGGNDFDTLFVTSMRKGYTTSQLEKPAAAGALFAVTGLPARGIPANTLSSCYASLPDID